MLIWKCEKHQNSSHTKMTLVSLGVLLNTVHIVINLGNLHLKRNFWLASKTNPVLYIQLLGYIYMVIGKGRGRGRGRGREGERERTCSVSYWCVLHSWPFRWIINFPRFEFQQAFFTKRSCCMVMFCKTVFEKSQKSLSQVMVQRNLL